MANETIPFMDLSWQWRQIAAEVMPRMDDLFARSAFSSGPFVEEFETAFAQWLGVEHVVACNTGTSALHLAMMAAGVGPGDKVLVPASTFIATAWGVVYAGATPVFCDVDPQTANIDVRDAERRLDPAVKAIVPVHLYGQPADMAAVTAFAARHGLAVIEDCAQAHGARIGAGKAGTVAPLGCFSFYPGKNLGAAGEGGAVVTSDAAMAARMRALRNHGQSQRYVHDEIGYNYRMDGIQGLVLTHKLRRLDDWTDMRRTIARRYLDGLSGLPVDLPEVKADDHVFHLFVIRTSDRDALKAHLEAAGIQTGLHYPVPLHKQPCFAALAGGLELPVAERWAAEGLSLPLFAGMNEAQADRVVATVRHFFGK